LVKTLNALAPFDWGGFFHTKLTSTSAEAPLGGIENGGWKVSFSDQPSKLEGRRGNPGDVYSIGLQVASDGVVADAIVGSPAFEAGISSQMKIIGVNGRVFTQELLSDAIKSAKDTSQPITLLVVVDDYFRTCTIAYHDGARYPHLVRDDQRPDYLDELIKPQAASH
jgi:predicted metalloprotease with PDZ domain